MNIKRPNGIKSKLAVSLFDALDDFQNKKIKIAQRRWIKKIEARRTEMKADHRELGAIARDTATKYDPSDNFVASQAILSEVVTRACKRPIWCRLLYTLVQNTKPKTAIELGTCVGVSTAYQAAAMSSYGGHLYTHEGSEDFSDLAKQNLEAMGIAKNATFVKGLFMDTLPKTLETLSDIDYVFIDGHHDGDATVRYYEMMKPKLAKNAIILLDDIRWSDGMEDAWNEILKDKDINFSVDMHEIGIVGIFEDDFSFHDQIKAQ